MVHRLACPLFLALLAPARGAPAEPPPAGPPAALSLSEGSVLQRDMGPGETHRYQVKLQEGEYLQLLVEQQGTDVRQTLTGPDGAVVLQTDAPCGPIGPDPLAFVSTASGRYRLDLEEAEVAVPPRGRYTIRVEHVRPPTAEDRLRASAVQAAIGAKRESGRNPRGQLEHDRVALAAWESLGDRRMQLWTLVTTGYAHAFDLDRPRDGEAPYRQALAIALELGDEWAEARVRDDLSQVEIRLGRYDETRALMERALDLHRAAGRPAYVAHMLTMLGSFFSLSGESQASLDRLYDALEINRKSGSPRAVAQTRLEIGATYLRVGDAELALDQYEQALPGLEDAGRRARCLTEMGVCRLKLGDHEGARRRYEEALALYRTLENAIAEADTMIGLGDLERSQGNLEAARTAFAAALAAYTARGYPLGIANAQCRLGEMQRRLGRTAEARSAFTTVLEGSTSSGSSRVCAEQGLARLDAQAGALEAAQQHAETAMKLLETRRSLASPRAGVAGVATRPFLFEMLTVILMRAHDRSPASGRDAVAFDVSERARARSLLDLLGEGRVDVTQGIRPELLAEERSLRQRLNAAARGARPAAGTANDELDRLSAQLAETQVRIRTASPHYASLTQSEPLTLAEIRSRVLDPETQLLQYALGEEQGYVWVVSGDRLESARLPPRAEIEAAALRLHQLLSAPPGLPGADAAGLRSAQDELSRLVLAPIAPLLRARRLLVVTPGALQYVPFASLSLPGGAPLLSRFELVSAPSASVIATLRDEARGRVPAAKAAAVFADAVFEPSDPRLGSAGARRTAARAARAQPTADPPSSRALQAFRGGLSRLPFSRGEAAAIASLMPRADSLAAVGFAANRATATSPALADYRIVHFATHAVLNTRQPELSGVVLSLYDAQGRPQDGFLRLHDVYNLRLGADLVVLSGCQTALGKDLKGEGLIGLARGFMYAGARGVLASLWSVDDESTAELMTRFYRALLKERQPPAAALRTAQLELARTPRWASPFHWAGFVLQGDWR